jgi:hypothetical protein
VLETNVAPADYAPLVLGQLKWMATNAYLELDARLPGGAGSAVSNLVRSFENTNNWLTVNVGQLKAVAQPFYDRLIEAGYTENYAWTAATNDDRDYAIATIGQLKFVFDFDASDRDADGLPDDWETERFGNLSQTGGGDFDGDGLSNLQEYEAGADPTNADSDGDGVRDGDDPNPATAADSDSDGLPDDWEIYWFGNLDQTATGDSDGDGVPNLEERNMGTDPTKANVEDTAGITGLEVYRPLL